MSLSLEESLEQARSFARHIRDPNTPLPKGVAQDRMAVYCSLFFRSMTGFLDETYEHLQRLLGEQWPTWQRQFFVDFQAHEPYFHRISSEFLSYVQQQQDFPIALEAVARYEQRLYDTEVLRQEITEVSEAVEADTDLARELLAQTPLMLRAGVWLEGFEYNVPALCQASSWQQACDQDLDQKLETPQFFCFYRNKRGRVKHKILAPMTVALLSGFEQATTPYKALTSLAESSGMAYASLEGFALDFIEGSLGDLLRVVR